MTSSGSAYGRFRRALDNGNLLAATAAAAELKHVAEALELTLLILAKEPTRFRAAALTVARSLLRRQQGFA
jgi:RecB family exonuclease